MTNNNFMHTRDFEIRHCVQLCLLCVLVINGGLNQNCLRPKIIVETLIYIIKLDTREVVKDER